MGRHATTIIGYKFNADTYCPGCIIDALPTGEGELFDGWALASGLRMTPEDNLAEIAHTFGIDRMDESSYDSDEFPKVVFAYQLEGPETCGSCFGEL